MKDIFVLEDEGGLREEISTFLQRRGFNLHAAGTIEEANRLLANIEHLDLALLDQNLGSGQTGAEFGLELRYREPFRMDPPEFTVYSGETDAKYFQQTIALGAAFRAKSTCLVEELMADIRTLLVRHGVKSTRPLVLAAIRELIDEATDIEEAVQQFCRHLLWTELKACLANPFFLILDVLDETTAFSASEEKELSSKNGNLKSILDIPEHAVRVFDDPEMIELIGAPITEVHCITLFRDTDMSLTLGLGQIPKSMDWRYPDQAGLLAEAFNLYFKPDFFKGIKSLMERFGARHEGILRANAQLCHSLGGELESLYEDFSDKGEPASSAPMLRLETLFRELQNDGERLERLEANLRESAHPTGHSDCLQLTRDAWESIRDTSNIELMVDGSSFPISAEAWAPVHEILNWMRERALQSDQARTISVRTEHRRRSRSILFEDESERCSNFELGQLFEPFPELCQTPTQQTSLYRARLGVIKLGGRLSDQTARLPTSRGHCFKLSIYTSDASI